MASEIDSQPLIRTKLYRPRVSEGLVHRPRLLERLVRLQFKAISPELSLE